VINIVKYPHPALRHKSRTLAMIDKEVRLLAGRMLELMYENHGLGLAANQVSYPYQLLVMNDLSDPEQKEHERVLINPVILERKGTMEGEEGCLSFPDLFQKVRRAKSVKVQAYNLEGQAIEVTASELPSRILQHEIDHLHGILFIDNMGPIARLASRSQLRKFEGDYKKAQERGDIPPDDEIRKTLDELEKNHGKGEPPPVM
jgi:peptide deformylase